MLRKMSFLTVLALILMSRPIRAAQINSTWVGGTEDGWETASNWSPAIVPDNNGTNTFAVTINNADPYQANIGLQYIHTIDRLDCYGKVGLQKWTYNSVDLTLVDANGLTNHGFLEVEDEINIKGDVLNVSGAWLNGWFNIEDGNLVNQTNARFDFTDNNIDVYDGNICNYGSIVCAVINTSAGKEFQNSGSIEMYEGLCSGDQAFRNEITGVIKGFGMLHSDQIIHNAGLIQSFGGSLRLHSRVDFEGPYVPNWGITNTGTLTNSPGTNLSVLVWVPDVNNNGIIEVNSDGAVVFDCNNLNNEPNAVIKLYGGTLSAETIVQKAGATLEGFGGITGNVVINSSGLIKLTGPTNVVGNVTIQAGATLEISDGQTLITGQTTNNGTIHLIGGTVIFQGGYTGTGNITHEAGTYRNHFDINSDGVEDFKDFAVFADNWLWQATWY